MDPRRRSIVPTIDIPRPHEVDENNIHNAQHNNMLELSSVVFDPYILLLASRTEHRIVH
jgi:hypothetical protein